MVKNLTDFLTQIDQMKIYEADYPIIMKLLALPENLFVKILEEILSGQLYFSDLEDIFADEAYVNLLDQELSAQNELIRKINNTVNFRKFVSNNVEAYSNLTSGEGYVKVIFSEADATRLTDLIKKYFEDPSSEFFIKNVPITLGYIQNTLKDSKDAEAKELIDLAEKKVSAELYEYFRVDRRDALLYSLMCMKDNDLIRGYKTRLFNMIETGRIVEKDKVTVYQNPQTGKNYIVDDNTEKDFIMPDDILFNASDAVIPINIEDQVLNTSDKQFMRLNNIDAETMKKMKSFYTLLVRQDLTYRDLKSGSTEI